MSVTVWTRPLDSTWEPVGVDRADGVYPEGLVLSADDYGPAGLDASLSRNPGRLHPDLSAFTPYDVWVDGMPVGIGEIFETPTRAGSDPAVALSGRGRAANLDDDVFQTSYVQSRLTDWQDTRSNILTPASLISTGTVEVGSAAIGIIIGDASTSGSIYLDALTPCNRLALTYIGSGGDNGNGLIVRGANSVADFATAANYESFPVDAAPLATALTSTTVSFTSSWRYFFIYFDSGTAIGKWLQIQAIYVGRQASYIASNTSALKASDVVADALTHASLIGQGTGKIATTSTVIKHLTTEGNSSPREVIERACVFERPQVRVNTDNELELRTRPTAPIFEVGDWPGAAEFEDASANSGAEIYTDAVIEGQDVSGTALALRRTIYDLPSPVLAAGQVPEGTFENGTVGNAVTGWTVTNPSGAGAAFKYQSASGGANGTAKYGEVTTSTGVGRAEAPMAGLAPGIPYVLRGYLRFAGVGTTPASVVVVGVGTATVQVLAGVWTPFALPFKATATSHTVRVDTFPSLATGQVDELFLYQAATLPGRNAFPRTQILNPTGPLSTTDSNTLADKFLTDHKRTPFSGTLTVTGPDAVRRVLGGQGVHPALFQRNVGEMIRFSNMIDPDTGAWGRDVYIAAADYDAETNTAVLSLDNTPTSFEQTLAGMEAG